MLKKLIGRKIVKIRPLTEKEAENEGWEDNANCSASVIELDDGTLIYPSRDPEGNGPGTLFGKDSNENKFYVYTERVVQ